MSAALSVTEREGLPALSVARILAESHETRKAFYDAFSDAEGCLHAALLELLDSAMREAGRSYRAAGSWQAGIREALHTLLALAEECPGPARIVILELPGGGPRLLSLRTHVLARASETIALGAAQSRARTPNPLLPAALAGGIAQILHERLRGDPAAKLTELGAPLTSLIVGAYLGPGAAARELSLAPVGARANGGSALTLGCRPRPPGHLRLTDRTVTVLAAIARDPGASNTQIARAAGIADPGQVSKLLARLSERGVAENISPTRMRKAWRLTALGQEIYGSLAAP